MIKRLMELNATGLVLFIEKCTLDFVPFIAVKVRF